MAEIVVENAVKRFGKFVAIDNVSLTVREQEFVVLLGPSGCGKTTLLRAIAGLGMVDSGRILIGGRDVTYLPPRERNISMVFQNYAIFPHMTVFDNIAFGLKMRKAQPDTIGDRVQNSAKLLHIEGMLDRYPSQMSGGQRQRIAVARAIAVETNVLLMDEPLSNLDALLRLEMRVELKSLLARLGVTTIYVTHDQVEALSMGDRIAVMRSGSILQCDTPTRVYDAPVDQFVGGFIGNPPMNFLSGRIEQQDHGQGDGIGARVGEYFLRPTEAMRSALLPYLGKPVTLGIRAESIEVRPEASAETVQMAVTALEPLGSHNLLTIRVGNDILKVSTHPDYVLHADDPIWLYIPPHKIRWINADTGRAILPEAASAVIGAAS